MDPLTELDALQEAVINELLFDVVNVRVGVLLDLRGALELRTAYTGLLILRGVESFRWENERVATDRRCWTVCGSEPRNENGRINLTLSGICDIELTVVARSGAFIAGDVPNITYDQAPPDLTDSTDEELAAGMASMDSQFEPTQLSVLEPFEEWVS